MAKWRKNQKTPTGLLICGNGLHTYSPELNECPACKELRNRKAAASRTIREREAIERGEPIRDPAHRKKLKRPKAYVPDPKDDDVKRCRAERARVLKEREANGPEWWRLAS
jgi:hypothetical protein